MDGETPPTRVTRSRAAARAAATEADVKIATAAAKARVMRNIVPTTNKRKTRADDTLEETNNNKDIMDKAPVKPKVVKARKKAAQSEIGLQIKSDAANKGDSLVFVPGPSKTTRGRPKKVIDVAPLKTTRGRPRRVVVDELVAETVAEGVKKTTHGRTIDVSKANNIRQPADDAIGELLKKTGRGRPTTATRAVAASKKNVEFQGLEEQDKENIIPVENMKGKAKQVEIANGLRARPLRKPTGGSRVIRVRPKAANVANKMPLTPKKTTQLSTAKDSVSEDELAIMEKTPMRPLTKSPIKAPSTILGPSIKLDLTASISANRTVTQGLSTSLMGSPARRPTLSPFKGSLKTSPKRVDMGDPMIHSPLKSSMLPSSIKSSPFKMPLLQSPARRPPSPTKICATSSRAGPILGSTLKVVPFSISTFNDPPRNLEKVFCPVGRLPLSPSKNPNGDATHHDMSTNVSVAAKFPGRLSCILPRDAEVFLPGSEENVDQPQNPCPFDRILIRDEEACAPQVSDTVITDGVQQAPYLIEQRSVTPTSSPTGYSIANFTLHADQDPFESSDSEDELASKSKKRATALLTAFNISANDFATPSTATPSMFVRKMRTTEKIPRFMDDLVHNSAESQSARAIKDKGISRSIARPLSDCVVTAPVSGSTPAFPMEGADYADLICGAEHGTRVETPAVPWSSPAKSSFFEDAISVSDAALEVVNKAVENDLVNEGLQALDFAPLILDEEDMTLAAEADEMSLISIQSGDETLECGDILNQSAFKNIKAISEASQEYGDENAKPGDQNQAPIDPVLLALDTQHSPATPLPTAQKVVTPLRILGERRTAYHTVSKVPLKSAAEDSPLKICKKSASTSKAFPKRPAPLTPFVVSQSPIFGSLDVITPARSSDRWTATTPLRTPRRNLNGQILKGAIVYVDVHTSEGADASAVFVELLVQMGAKCVKTWTWNPNKSNSSESDSSYESAREQAAIVNGRIYITHVVFKDGGKRTLEKVKESNGVVLCVGVGWVLDCERQNTWLLEAPYAIDTAMIPRGGHRRRKSMEPRSIQKLNGVIPRIPLMSGTPRDVSSVSAGHDLSLTQEFLNLPDTPGMGSRSARRKSTLWVRNSSSDGDGDENGSAAGLLLSPVPTTPAPETLSAYAELDDLTLDGAETPYYLKREQLVQRTCPPKRSTAMKTATGPAAFDAFDDASSHPDVDGPSDNHAGTRGEILMQRLLLARRKSLQWAPKVGSPLAKGGLKA